MNKKLVALICILTILLSAMLVSCKNKDKISLNNKEKLENLQFKNEKDGYVGIELYFDASKDGKKEKTALEERLIDKQELLGEIIIQELIKGPSVKSELKPILPKETRLLSFSINDGIASINLSKEAKVHMTSVKEKACLESIASSLGVLKNINKIQILVENKGIDTLGGNYDISTPFSKDEIDIRKIKH